MRTIAAAALLSTSALSGPAFSQDAPTGDAPAPAPQEAVSASTPTAGAQVYTAADFVRYAPKTAADMVTQVPGFGIRESEQLRGLGQATGNVLFNGRRPSTK